MTEKINSFTETVNKFVEAGNIALNFAQKTNEALTTEEDTVTMTIQSVDPITGDSSTATYDVPSYNSVIQQLNNANQTIETFTSGSGQVLLNDGTYRQVSVTAVPVSPAQITNVDVPTQFKAKSNWFFEDLMFPQIVVSFDLKNKIDDRSDRISVRRVIFNNDTDAETQWFQENLAGQEMDYFDVITLLSDNNKKYWQDDQLHILPLSTEEYTGYFNIIDKQVIDGQNWFYLDTLKFGVPSDEPVVYNLQLAKSNFLRFNNGIYKINDIEVSEKRVQLIPMVGIEHPGVGGEFEIYSAPFSTKIADIPVGFDECNVMFIKGINDDYNIIADDWSKSIAFYTNDLTLTDNSEMTMDDYYNQYVSDFGKQMEGEAKEKFIPAWFGVTPDAPVIEADAIEVSQINDQLNSSLDSEEVKNTQTQIESTKTIVNSLKSTISQQKAEIVSITDPAQREDINSKISINVSDLAKRTVEYQSLVKSLTTIAYESDAVTANPKYRARGFFPVPGAKKKFPDSRAERPQEVIGFELAYRYLRKDGTGKALKSYILTDSSSGRIKKGVFSDWTIISTPVKERVYDSSLGRYTWVSPNIADGDEVNINQLDIPIRKGEKLQIKVRSISEAGYPVNPKKSDWSEPVIKDFPANLSSSDQITNILTDAVAEENNIALEETLTASGVTSHISDSIPNPTSGDGTYFKHQAVNLAYDLSQKNIVGTVTSTNVTDLQKQISDLAPNTFVTLTQPSGATGEPHVTGTLQLLLQAMVNVDPSIYEEFEALVTTSLA